MIKLQADSNGKQHRLQLRQEGQTVAVDIDGRTYSLEVHDSYAGEYLLRNETQVYNCRVERSRSQPDTLVVSLRGESYAVKLIDPKRSRSLQSSGAQDHGSAQIVAPMPGRIVRLLVEVGARVEAGAGIVVVEAMKMQNEMKSPKAGIVTSLKAKAGDTVNSGDVLAEIE